ncbi:MAG: FAD-dependent oxidoreductase [Vicinamibacteria bacterium]
MRIPIAFVAALTLLEPGCHRALGAASPPYDVVVYGGTAAGLAAAVQARAMGRTVVLVEPGQRLGGLTSGGLGNTDIGNKRAVGGLARSFYERVAAHYAKPAAWVQETREEYAKRGAIGNQGHGGEDPLAVSTGRPTMWVFEPKVAEGILHEMAAEANVPVRFGQRLDRAAGVVRNGTAVASIRMKTGETYEARVFVDATYEGDLMAAAGVAYAVGREGNAQYGETLNGVQTRNAKEHQFRVRVDPWRVPGHPESGLLAGIHDGGPGSEGEGDRRVQAYNFRMTLTDAPANRLPIPAPEGYDPARYELLRRYVAAGVWDAIALNSPMPNRKTDVNNHGAFSSDHIGANYDWPGGDDATRDRIFRDHVAYVQGLWYFLQNDPRLPAAVREEAGKWGLCRDEFAGSDHWPPQLYVREARRMVGEAVMTEAHCTGRLRAEDSIGLAAYGMDSHNVQRYVADGAARNEGDVQVPVRGPYPVSYRAITPRRAEVTNLLVPVALSASHIAYGSIRMEPVFMVLGQSAATAASLAIDGNGVVQDVAYEKLRGRLLRDGQILQ